MDSVSRRKFMAGAFGAAAAPLLLEPFKVAAERLVADSDFKAEPKAPSARIKTGFIGVGGRGTTLLKTLLRNQQAELVAICDIRPEAIDAATRLCVGMSPKGYANYHDLLAQNNVEAVFIATPVDLHAEMAEAVVAANKHLYCEKPMGADVKQAMRTLKAAESSKKVFQVGFQWVYNSNFLAAINAVHEGQIGEVRFAHAQRHGAGDVPEDKPWLMDKVRSGDIIVEQAVHEMNVFCWGLKDHPVEAWGTGGINYYVNIPPGRTVMDNYSLSLLYPNDVRVAYSHMFFAPKPLDNTHIFFFGTKGAVDVMKGEIYLTDGKKPEPKPMKLTDDDTYNAILSFCDKVMNGGKPDADAHKGINATMTSILGRTAIYKKEPVTWNKIA